MKVEVIQAHGIPVETAEGLKWLKRAVGQQIEIEERDFAPNLHKRIEKKAEIGKRKAED